MEYIVLFAIVAVLALLSGSKRNYKRNRKSNRSWSNKKQDRTSKVDITDTSQQLKYVHAVEFKPQKLLNKPEARIFKELEVTVKEHAENHRVMAQVNLGEFLKVDQQSGTKQDRFYAYRSINSKRVDFLIIDRFGTPVIALEYQGDGHHQKAAFIRDAVKKEAMRKAGIHFIEINKGDLPGDIRKQVAKLLTGERATSVQDQSQATPKIVSISRTRSEKP